MIQIGLTTWSEHASLLKKKRPTLIEYSSKLPLVEVDTPFYGIPRQATVEKWVNETPENFRFIVKAHQTMTRHAKWEDFFETEKELYSQYKQAISPLVETGKLESLLFQFPPFFDCTNENIVYLKRVRKIFPDYPIAIELRNNTWFLPQFLNKTIEFMRSQHFILVIIDEPQVPNHSIPFYPVVTNNEKVIFRLHGRNLEGWQSKGEDWRRKRTLYRYNHEELSEFGEIIGKIAKETKTTNVIFNNNSGGDAADNALSLKEILNVEYEGLNPEQMDLF